jgi:DNA repair exonuclease SbcCD ATPase subunit
MKTTPIIFLASFLLPTIAQPGVYKNIDESGNVTYSNIRSNKAEQLDLPPITVVPGIDSAAVEAKNQKRMQSIQIEEQREALENQISEEANRLEELENEYKGGTPDRLGNERMNYQRYLDRVERLKSEIAISEHNLKKLEAELQQLPSVK